MGLNGVKNALGWICMFILKIKCNSFFKKNCILKRNFVVAICFGSYLSGSLPFLLMVNKSQIML